MRPDQDLKLIVEQGKRRISKLRSQTQRFQPARPDQQHDVLTTAVWITRIDRARRLSEVPPENLALVKAHYDRLKAIFPQEFWGNPFDPIADQIEELGMSFEELKQTGLDAEIDWKESDALRGTGSHPTRIRENSPSPPPPNPRARCPNRRRGKICGEKTEDAADGRARLRPSRSDTGEAPAEPLKYGRGSR